MEQLIKELRAYPTSQDWSHHPRATELEAILPRVKTLEAIVGLSEEFPDRAEEVKLGRQLAHHKAAKHRWTEKLLDDEGDQEAKDRARYHEKKIEAIKPR